MSTLRENVEASLVVGVLVAGEPDIAFLRDEADQQDKDRRCRQAERSKDDEQIFERVEHPDTAGFLPSHVEGGGSPQPDGVQKHPIEIQADDARRDVERKVLFVAVIPSAELICETVFQFFQQSG